MGMIALVDMLRPWRPVRGLGSRKSLVSVRGLIGRTLEKIPIHTAPEHSIHSICRTTGTGAIATINMHSCMSNMSGTIVSRIEDGSVRAGALPE